MTAAVDYIVIGGGSAGSAVAGRLSEDAASSVCLLEAGGSGESVIIRIPFGYAVTMTSKKFNWCFDTEPQAGLDGRRGYQPRGKGLGGSSAINSMLYIRGHPGDYDEWAKLGCRGWAYADVLPFFIKAENNVRGKSLYHGDQGPLSVSDQVNPLPQNELFFEACRQTQLPITDDFNGENQEGAGLYQVTQTGGERCSAARAYVHGNRNRANLRVETQARVHRIIVENARATGVIYRQNGQIKTLMAKKEVILSAGALQSPHILMLSGIGPAEQLKQQGIEVVHDLPGVGENLQDHLNYVTNIRTTETGFLGVSLRGGMTMLKGVYDWFAHRRGILTSPFSESGAFFKTHPDLDRPNIQLHFTIGIDEDHGRKLRKGHGFCCHACLLRPKSRGRVFLKSADPEDDPGIDMGFLDEAEDLEELIDGVALMQRILDAPAFDGVRGEALTPFSADDRQSIAAAIRQSADTVYHPSGTCAMGSGKQAVVDPTLKLHGIHGLRVVDASIMPRLIGGNTNAPSIMIGERGADFIRSGN